MRGNSLKRENNDGHHENDAITTTSHCEGCVRLGDTSPYFRHGVIDGLTWIIMRSGAVPKAVTPLFAWPLCTCKNNNIRLEIYLANSLPERHTLKARNLKLIIARLARAISALYSRSQHASSPEPTLQKKEAHTAIVPAPQGLPPRTSSTPPKIEKVVLYPNGT